MPTSVVVSSSPPPTKRAVLSLFTLCGRFHLLCSRGTGQDLENWIMGNAPAPALLWDSGYSRRLRLIRLQQCYIIKFIYFSGPQRHVTKIQLMRSSPVGLFLVCPFYFMYLFMYFKIGCSIFLPHNPTLIEKRFFFSAQLKLSIIVCKYMQVVF